MKITVDFAQIDARDDVATGYRPVAFTVLREGKAYPDRIEGLNERNQFLVAEMEMEYLAKLHSLQEELKAKYVPLFDTTDGLHPFGDDISLAAEKAAKGKFPGPYASYYT